VIDVAMEEEGPSKTLILLTIIPPVIFYAVFRLTDNFSVEPKLPVLYHAIVPLILLLMSLVASFMGYTAARDEEPEWGWRLPYKVLQALHIGYLFIALILVVFVVTMYFLR